jgi:hypothetical protein
MNLWEMVIIVVALTGLTTIGKAYIDARGRRVAPAEAAENERLRTQVKQLQGRIHVLERIVTDKGIETAGQIEALRDRERTQSGDEIP